MNLNVNKSLEDYFYGNCSEEIERELIEKYINSVNNSYDYEKSITDISCIEEIYSFSSIGQNIINWYPFSKNATVLEIGGRLGNITELLCKKDLDVTCIEPVKYRAEAIAKRCHNYPKLNIICSVLDKLKLKTKFDYIIIINNLEFYKELMGKQIKLEEFFKFISTFLKDNGRLIINFNNNNSIRRIFNYTTNKYLNENNTFNKTEVDSALENIGLKFKYNYYPLPDSRLTNVIFSDAMLPDENNINKFVSYYEKNTFETFNENDALRTIISEKKEMFTVFTNSYFIDAGREELNQKYCYISFNNLRKEEYRLITKISCNDVTKEPVNQLSVNHYRNLVQNIEMLEKNKILILDSCKDGKIISKYKEQKYMVYNILLDYLKKNNMKGFYNLFNKFVKEFSPDKLLPVDLETIINDNIFKKYNIKVDKECIKKMNFVHNGFWDMTITNCFYIEGMFYFFDQEWKDLNVPVEYIIFKNIFYSEQFDKYISKKELYKYFNIEEFVDIFLELDLKIQEEIRDKKIWNFYTRDYHKNIINLINDYNRIDNEFKEYKKITDELISAKDTEIQNCNIRLENSKRKIEDQEIIINRLSESFTVKVTRNIKRMLKGEKKDEKKN